MPSTPGLVEDQNGGSDRSWWLLGISCVCVVLAIVAYVGIPRWQDARRTARARATLSDLRGFAAAFQAYAHDHADWPPTVTAPGAIPPKMADALAHSHWQQRTPLGGRYVWLVDTVQRGQRIRAVIAIVSEPDNPVSDDRRQLERLQQIAPSTGLDPNRLRLGFHNEPIYVLEN